MAINQSIQGVWKDWGLFRFPYKPDKYESQLITDQKTAQTIDNQMLLNIQIKKLQRLEQSKKNKYKIAYDFIQSAQKKSMELRSLGDEVEQASVSGVYNRIIEILNIGLWGNINNPTRMVVEENRKQGRKTTTQAQLDQHKAQEKALLNELSSLLSQINVNEPVRREILDKFQERIQYFHASDIKKYVQFKADYAEKAAVEVVNQNPTMRAIQSGKFKLDGKSIIEDFFAFNKGYDIKNNDGLTFTLVEDGKKNTMNFSTLNDFLDIVGKLKATQTIALDNKLYEFLQKNAALAGQVKSGRFNQDILTKAKRNSLRFSDLSFWKYVESLAQLYRDQGTPWLPQQEQNSKYVEAFANYALAQNITKTRLTENQVYFTERGIESASEWMQNTQKLLKFADKIKSLPKRGDKTQYRYQFYKA